MKMLICPLAIAAAFGIAGFLGTNFLSADPPKPTSSDPPAVADPAKPTAEAPMLPVKVTDAKTETKTAVDPKPLSAAVKRALEYIVKYQQEDGGWNQGGGWRTQPAGGG